MTPLNRPIATDLKKRIYELSQGGINGWSY